MCVFGHAYLLLLTADKDLEIQKTDKMSPNGYSYHIQFLKHPLLIQQQWLLLFFFGDVI